MDRIWMTGHAVMSWVNGAKDLSLLWLNLPLSDFGKRDSRWSGWLITGGQLGIEQWAIEVALELQATNYPEFQIALMTPVCQIWRAMEWSKCRKIDAAKSHQSILQALFTRAILWTQSNGDLPEFHVNAHWWSCYFLRWRSNWIKGPLRWCCHSRICWKPLIIRCAGWI